MRTITRTTNPNGTYRYEIDGDVIYKASKVLYTHASSYTVGETSSPVLFHKTEAAASRARGYQGWVKTGMQAIEDGDAAATADADDAASDGPRLRGTKVEYRHAATGQWRPATVTGYRAHQDTYILATDHGSDAAVAGDVRTPKPLKVPRVRAKVVANAGPSHLRGRQGRVESKGRGDDGELYVTVEFDPGVTWPFLVSELTLV